MSADVLVIDDDEGVRVAIEHMLRARHYQVHTASSGEQGLEMCARQMPALVLLDLRLPDIGGMEILRHLKEMDPDCKVVMITAYNTASLVTEAINLGVEDYLTKPVTMVDMLGVVAKLIGHPEEEDPDFDIGLEKVVGESPAMHRVLEIVRRISKTSATILLTGESGTGKEEIARAIHLNSGPGAGGKEKPFVSINCASIPGNLLEDELFGHERGAFTDARTQKAGLIEVAAGGTLLLDEIGLMPLDLQSKLLTLLETRKFRRLGGTEELHAHVHFLAATNTDLEKAMAAGAFREDLYYRLNVIPIELPPLRDRGDDVLLLSRHFLGEFSQQHKVSVRELSPDAEGLVKTYSWPGNVRELRNVIERAVLLTSGSRIEALDLSIERRDMRPEEPQSAPIEVTPEGLIHIVFPKWGIPLEDLERQVIEAALEFTEGNISGAARLLHISRYALRYRMQKHDIDFSQK
ncbi:MAG: sigma-54 dependent transcriptional regulator [bacterium]|nr:sigma-54 dependent transcriptional regulator [bacterium]